MDYIQQRNIKRLNVLVLLCYPVALKPKRPDTGKTMELFTK